MNILLSKILVPDLPATFIHREWLAEKMTTLHSAPVVLLQAPAGYGKSTLARALLPETGLQSFWYALDESDNDPATFLSYFATGLSRLITLPDTLLDDCQHKRLSNTLHAGQMLVNYMVSASEQHCYHLVFDDVHLLQSESVSQLLHLILETLAGRCRLYLTSRRSLPPAYAKWQLSGKLFTLQQDLLRFSPEDVKRFLLAQPQYIQTDEFSLIEQLLEGWPAGLQLLKLSQQSALHFTQQLQQLPSLTSDYLYYEVMRHFSAEIQNFLRMTAIVDAFNPALASALTGYDANKTQHCIQTLLESNAFIVPLSADDPWFRYHHLVTHYLRHQAQQSGMQVPIHQCHRNASDWFLQHGYAELATKHALASEMGAHIIKVLQQVGWDLYNQGQTLPLQHCFELLGVDQICTDPSTTLQAAWFYKVMKRDYATVQRLLQQAEQTNPSQAEQIMYQLIRGHIAAETGAPQTAIEAAEQAYRLNPDPMESSLALAYSVHSLGLSRLGQLQQALNCSLKAEKIDLREQQIVGVLWHQSMQIQLLSSLGQLSQAEAVLQQAFSLLAQQKIPYLPKLDLLCHARAQVTYEQMQFEQALSAAKQALRHSAQWPHSQLPYWTIQLAAATILEQHEAANSALQQGLTLLLSTPLFDDVRTDFCIAVCHYYHRNQFTAPDWLAQQLNQITTPNCRWNAIRHHYAQALYALYFADQHTADRHLKALQQQVSNSEFGLFALRSALLETLYLLQYDSAHAKAALQTTLKQAQQLNCYSPFMEQAHLLMQHQDAFTLLPDTVRNVLSSHTHSQCKQHYDLFNKTHQLTEREWEILRSLQNQRSNEQLADDLYISINTLKKHLKNIYRKLDVTERKDAIEIRDKMLSHTIST